MAVGLLRDFFFIGCGLSCRAPLIVPARAHPPLGGNFVFFSKHGLIFAPRRAVSEKKRALEQCTCEQL